MSRLELTFDQIVSVLQDEYRYWANADGRTPQEDAIAMGGAGALSNVIATLTTGRPAPWHTSHPLHPVPVDPDAFIRCPCPTRRDCHSTEAIVL